MKPEPLKNKELTGLNATPNDSIFLKKDIRSAVEWLKLWIIDQMDEAHQEFWIKRIEAAFPDIFKEKKHAT